MNRSILSAAARCLLAVLLLNCPGNLSAQKPRSPQWEAKQAQAEARARAIISQMTVEEKIGQLMNQAPGIERLGILPYSWWNEALHGVARNGRATVYPEPIGLAATFDETLVRQLGGEISDEGRSKYELAAANGNFSQYTGLTYWAPNVNIFRDPRWGRGMETYGEDPFLAGTLGGAFVRGVQGDDPFYLKAAACAKHYAVHSGPEGLRHSFDVSPSPRDFRETYLPAFRMLVEDARVEAVMGAYNRVYGQSASGSRLLLQDILRGEWGFRGHVVSDCGAVTDIWSGHHIATSEPEGAALALKSGLNLECGQSMRTLGEALRQGYLTEEDLDKALLPLFVTRYKLGILGHDPDYPYYNIPLSTVASPEHAATARRAARESMVLIKNAAGTLPLRKDHKSVYVVGPLAADAFALMGNYYGISNHYSTYLEGLAAAVSASTAINYKPGFLLTTPNTNDIDWVSGEAKASEVAIVFVGNTGLTEGEEGEAIASTQIGDRTTLEIPGTQLAWLRKISRGHRNKLVTIVTGGSPVNLREIVELSDAVILSWYPGQEGGAALAELLFGDASPSGRLPVTFPEDVSLLPPIEDYTMQGRTYKYMDDNIQYPFGFGLGYGDVRYEAVSVQADNVRKGAPLQVEVRVRNVGNFAQDEVVQLYLVVPGAGASAPLRSLVGFGRVSLPAGQERTLRVEIPAERLETVGADGKSSLLRGAYTLIASGAAPCPRAAELGVSSVQAGFTVR